MNHISKMPQVATSIFTVMGTLAKEHQAINLSQGFPNFDCSATLKDLVYKAMQAGHNQYAPMQGLPSLTEQLAIKTENLYHKVVNPTTEITITSGATEAIFVAINTFVHKGDEVILIEPAYDSYKPCVELCGGIAIPYIMEAPNFKIDWSIIQQLVTSNTRMIIINTPHNPTGYTMKSSDWQALTTITKDTNILILSDEVYEHIIFDGQQHESVLRYPNLWERTISTFSFGKTFHNTGWKMGYCIAPNYLMKEFRKVHQFVVFSVNTPIQHALATFLKNPTSYLSIPNFYQKKRNLFLEILRSSRFKPLACEGTYFQMADYSALSHEKDTDFAIRMTKEYGVAVIPPSVFYSNHLQTQTVRFCFCKTDETLEKAGEILCKI